MAVSASCLGGANRPAGYAQAVKVDFRQQELENGLRVVTHVDPSYPIVALALAVEVGASDDPPGKEGLAHAVEHLAFRAEHSPGVTLQQRLRALGADYNGLTSPDVTVYHAVAPRSSLHGLLEIFSDLATRPTYGVAAEAFETERGVLDNERRVRSENGAPGQVFDRLQAALYGSGSLGRPIAGTAASLRTLTLSDAETFAADHYRPARMTLVVAGALDAPDKLELEGFRVSKLPSKPRALTASKPSERRIEIVPSSVATPELWIGFRLPSAYGADGPMLALIERLADAALYGEAAQRHPDVAWTDVRTVTSRSASTLICRAVLTSTNDADGVMDSLIHVMRKGIASRLGDTLSRSYFARGIATDLVLLRESLQVRTLDLALGAALARDPGLPLSHARSVENVGADAAEAFYDRHLRAESARAVLVLPASAEELRSLPMPPAAPESLPASALELERAIVAPDIGGAHDTTLSNGLRVIALERPGAKFQTALLGFHDGASRTPWAVGEASDFGSVNYIMTPKSGISHRTWRSLDSKGELSRAVAVSGNDMFEQLAERLDRHAFEWKSEQYLDYRDARAEMEREPRVVLWRQFRHSLFRGHVYGVEPLTADVDAITVNHLHDWYIDVHRPENATLVFVGPLTGDAATAAADTTLGRYRSAAERRPPVAPLPDVDRAPRTGPRFLTAERPRASQAELHGGCLLDATPALVPAQELFSALLETTIESELRSRTGATYGTQIRLERLRGDVTALTLTMSVATEHVVEAIAALHRLFVSETSDFDATDVESKKLGVISGHALSLQTTEGVAWEILQYTRLGWPLAAIDSFPRRVAEATLANVERERDVCRATALLAGVGNEAELAAAWQRAQQ